MNVTACGRSARCSNGRRRTCGPTSRRATCRTTRCTTRLSEHRLRAVHACGRARCRSALGPLVVGEPGLARVRPATAPARDSAEGRAASRRLPAAHLTMDYFPIFLRLAGEPVLVVGGGEVAARKIDLLLRTSAKVRVVAPELVAGLAERVAAGEIAHIAAEFIRSIWTACGWRSRRPTSARSMRGSRTRPSAVTFRSTSSTIASCRASSCRQSSIARRSSSRSAAAAMRRCSRVVCASGSNRSCRNVSARSRGSPANCVRRSRRASKIPRAGAVLGKLFRRHARRRRACGSRGRCRSRVAGSHCRLRRADRAHDAECRRSRAGRRRSWRSGSADAARAASAAECGRDPLRPARVGGGARSRTSRCRAHQRRQGGWQRTGLARRDQRAARASSRSRASACAGSRAAILSSSAAAARSSKRSLQQACDSKSCRALQLPQVAPRTQAFR